MLMVSVIRHTLWREILQERTLDKYLSPLYATLTLCLHNEHIDLAPVPLLVQRDYTMP